MLKDLIGFNNNQSNIVKLIQAFNNLGEYVKRVNKFKKFSSQTEIL